MMKATLVLVVTILLVLAGTAAAQWWNPMESDCAKSARLQADAHCDDGGWKKLELGDYDKCYATIYSRALGACLKAGAGN